MVKKGIVAQARDVVSNADQIFYLFTGKRLRQLGARAVELYGEDVAKSLEEAFMGKKEDGTLDFLYPDNPYRTLEIEPSACDVVVKGAFRSLIREYHTDTGRHPDAKKFQEVVEAYNAIMQARAEEKKPKA